MGIYVEILVRAPMDDLWARTQDPALHERWDLRFSRITYLPRASESEPQRFRYETRIGFGIVVAGDGESVGERSREDGSRTSALRFASASPLSLIRQGSGYWKYVPDGDAVRFLTWYDYETRWGLAGRLLDRAAFRPLMGWATAWSFDRLRAWLERGAEPAAAARQAVVHATARLALAAILAWQGLVPKLLGPHADELAMVAAAGIAPATAPAVVTALGVAELLAAALLLATWRRPWLPLLVLVLMPLVTLGVAVTTPAHLGAAFNPVALNLAVAALAVVDLVAGRALPTATNCRRRPPRP